MFAVKKSVSHTEGAATRPDQIFLVRGRDMLSKSAWYFMAVDRDKRDIFRSSHGVSAMKLSDYGRILFSGYGSEPPKAIKELMFVQYGFSA